MGDENETYLLKKLIKQKYGTLRNLATKMGIDETNLNNKLKRRSKTFLKDLEQYDIYLPNSSGMKNASYLRESMVKYSNLEQPLALLDGKYLIIRNKKYFLKGYTRGDMDAIQELIFVYEKEMKLLREKLLEEQSKLQFANQLAELKSEISDIKMKLKFVEKHNLK